MQGGLDIGRLYSILIIEKLTHGLIPAIPEFGRIEQKDELLSGNYYPWPKKGYLPSW